MTNDSLGQTNRILLVKRDAGILEELGNLIWEPRPRHF